MEILTFWLISSIQKQQWALTPALFDVIEITECSLVKNGYHSYILYLKYGLFLLFSSPFFTLTFK